MVSILPFGRNFIADELGVTHEMVFYRVLVVIERKKL